MSEILKRIILRMYIHSAHYVVVYSGILGVLALLGWIRIVYSIYPGNSQFFLPSLFWEGVFLVLLLCISMAWLFLWGWYLATYRYFVYFLTWILSHFRRLLLNRFVQFFISFGVVGFLQRLHGYIMVWPDNYDLFDVKKILQWRFLIETLAVALLLFLFIGLVKLRKRIIIEEFTNNTGCKELDCVVKGLSRRLVSEIMGTVSLYKTIDDIQTTSNRYVDELTLVTADISEDVSYAMGTQSEISAGFFKIPLGPVFKALGHIVQNHKLSGCLQREGNRMVLIACISGGRMKGNWIIESEEIIEEKFEKCSTKLISKYMARMVEDLTLRIFITMTDVGSPRWEAVKCYTLGLRKYRETVRTNFNKILLLQESKTAFYNALAFDNNFSQCYYNLGIVYHSQGNIDSALNAFWKALGKKRDNFGSLNEMARNYLVPPQKDDNDAKWFGKQPTRIFPSNPRAWHLKLFINYKIWYNVAKKKHDYLYKYKVPKDLIFSARNATMLSWRQLCHQMLMGKGAQIEKNLACVCVRNLGVLRGLDHSRHAPWLFKQALFLSPDDPDLYLEMGEAYYRRGKFKKLYSIYDRIFEGAKDVSNSILFWALYFHAYAESAKNETEYLNNLKVLFSGFLDAIASVVQNEEIQEASRDDVMPYKFKIIELINAELKRSFQNNEEILFKKLLKQLEYLSNAENFVKPLLEIARIKDESQLKEQLEQFNKSIDSTSNDDEVNYLAWNKAQREITIAKQCLNYKNYHYDAIHLLERAFKILKVYFHREIVKLRLNYYLAKGYLNVNQSYKALMFSSQAVRENPFNAEERYLLGMVYLKLDNYEKALTELECSFRLMPNQPDILKTIGEVYQKKAETNCDPQEREKFFTSAILLFNQALKIKGSRSSISDMPDLINESKTDEDKSVKYRQEVGLIHYFLGYFYNEQAHYGDRAKFETAASNYQIAYKLGYQPLQTQVKLGWVYVNAELFSRAKQVFDEAEQILNEADEDDLEYWIHIKLGQAVALVEGAVDLSKRSNRYKEIQKLLERVLEKIKMLGSHNQVEPNVKNRLMMIYHECQGQLSLKEDNYEKAIEHFSNAIEAGPHERVYYRLAHTYKEFAIQNKSSKGKSLIALARVAAELSVKHDLRQRYKKLVDTLLVGY